MGSVYLCNATIKALFRSSVASLETMHIDMNSKRWRCCRTHKTKPQFFTEIRTRFYFWTL